MGSFIHLLTQPTSEAWSLKPPKDDPKQSTHGWRMPPTFCKWRASADGKIPYLNTHSPITMSNIRSDDTDKVFRCFLFLYCTQRSVRRALMWIVPSFSTRGYMRWCLGPINVALKCLDDISGEAITGGHQGSSITRFQRSTSSNLCKKLTEVEETFFG